MCACVVARCISQRKWECAFYRLLYCTLVEVEGQGDLRVYSALLRIFLRVFVFFSRFNRYAKWQLSGSINIYVEQQATRLTH